MKCPKCQGSGEIRKEQKNGGRVQGLRCIACNGSGKVIKGR